ncbi:MAG: DUF4037 domain-containing protein [Chloroflexi bacterium]|nr:DUF4037 domain-containing protein [Chloroflexota bacterium]
MFFSEIVQPILEQNFPDLSYSAALIGYGSEVLGYDNSTSTDHNWGPRLQLFVSPRDFEMRKNAILECLRQKLPRTFRDFPVNFSEPDWSDGGTQRMQFNEQGPVNHLVKILTMRAFFESTLGVNPETEIQPIDWLTFPEQALLEVTRGKVFHDGLHELEPTRAKFAYYPRDVWLYRLAAQWKRISQEEPFVGRCGDVGDDLGSRIVAARLVRDVMRLAFLMERQYAPYSKWLGTAFARLGCAEQLAPIFERVLDARMWKERETHLCDAYVILAEMHNALGITERLEPMIASFFGRPYHVIFAERFAKAIRNEIRDDAIKSIRATIGGVDQFSDSTDLTDNVQLSRKLRVLYTGETK